MSWKHEAATDYPALNFANPAVDGNPEAGEAPAMHMFGSPSPVEPNHRQASGALNSSQQEPHADIDSAGLKNDEAEPSSPAAKFPRLGSGERILRPTMRQTSRTSREKPSRNDRLPQPAAKEKPGPQPQLNVLQI